MGGAVVGALVIGAVLLDAGAVGASVRSTTQINAYRVGGTTAQSLVSYMRTNPFPGDRGAAVANIRPSYSLSIANKQSGGICRASSVDLNIRFVMTLPQAKSSLSGGTKSAWAGFTAFARRHEERHKAIYLSCANGFVAKAERLTASSCFALNAKIRSLLEAEKRACDRKQLAFDMQDYRRVFGLSLFAMARYNGGGRKPVRLVRAAVVRVSSPPPVPAVSAPAAGLVGPR